MPHWRKTSWVIVIWTALFVLWLVGGVNAANQVPVGSSAEAAGRAIGTGIGVSLIIGLWFIGFIVLSLIWFMTRPRGQVTVYGPNGQQVLLSESDARRRVEKGGWTYQPQSGTAPAPPSETRWGS
jgi:hypothetical protein